MSRPLTVLRKLFKSCVDATRIVQTLLIFYRQLNQQRSNRKTAKMSRFVVTYKKWLLTTEDFYNKCYCQVPGCLPFTQTTRVEILCINIKLKNLTWWQSNPLQSISKSTEQTKTGEKLIASNYSPYFLKLPKQNKVNHLIFQPEFPVFPCKW